MASIEVECTFCKTHGKTTILDRWRYDLETESLSDAIRRMDRHLKKHGENGVC